MAVYRVERTRDYTVMSNFHFPPVRLVIMIKEIMFILLQVSVTFMKRQNEAQIKC